jgi:hypothetical protein
LEIYGKVISPIVLVSGFWFQVSRAMSGVEVLVSGVPLLNPPRWGGLEKDELFMFMSLFSIFLFSIYFL